MRAPPKLPRRMQRALQPALQRARRAGKRRLGGRQAALAELFPHLRRVPEALGRVGGHLGGWCQRPRRPRRPRQVELTNDRGPTADL